MKIKDVRPQSFVKMLRCDRCGRETEDSESEFFEFTSIDYKAGYGSILGDQNHVEIDLCQHCLKETLGPWLRITEPTAPSAKTLKALELFDPDRHGGELSNAGQRPSSKTGSPHNRWLKESGKQGQDHG